MRHTKETAVVLFALATVLVVGCERKAETARKGETTVRRLRGAASYTPYDSAAMIWARSDPDRSMVWVSSGGAAGRLLVSSADAPRRPDWILCTQGVVAGLSARGEKIRIIATVYQSDAAILPVFRKPRRSLRGARSLFIPRSSIEFAFDRLLVREGLVQSDIRVPSVESVGFSTIKSLLKKPASDSSAIDFAILVDPFITNLMSERPDAFEIGEGGLYEMHYSVVVRERDIRQDRASFERLLQEMISADGELQSFASDAEFYEGVWGRSRDGQPEHLPRMVTFSREPMQLALQPDRLRHLLREEIEYLVRKYPDSLRQPADVDAVVDDTILRSVAPDRIHQ